MNNDLNINDIGLEIAKTEITKARVGKVDNMWLVEYRRKPKWFFDRWWWFDDGKYIDYREAVARAKVLAEAGYVTKLVTAKPMFDVATPVEDNVDDAQPHLSDEHRDWMVARNPGVQSIAQPQVIRKVIKKVVRPAPAQWANPQDLDGDGDIDEDDYRLYEAAKRWEDEGWENPQDLDGDGDIDEDDFKLYNAGDRWDVKDWDDAQDLDGDGDIDEDDYRLYEAAKRWEQTDDVQDMDGDGDIDEDDYRLYEAAKRWEQGADAQDLDGDGDIDEDDFKLYNAGDRWEDKPKRKSKKTEAKGE
jgi:hypothetical protein